MNITPQAVKEIKAAMQAENLTAEEYYLNLGVKGGGCSGFSYKMEFVPKAGVDKSKFEEKHFDGLDVVVDKKSLLYIGEVTVDFLSDLNKRGFVFNNPVATGRCGCGSSFSV